MNKVVAMVNLDMVGRLGPSGLAIGGLDSSEQWMPLLDELATIRGIGHVRLSRLYAAGLFSIDIVANAAPEPACPVG